MHNESSEHRRNRIYAQARLTLDVRLPYDGIETRKAEARHPRQSSKGTLARATIVEITIPISRQLGIPAFAGMSKIGNRVDSNNLQAYIWPMHQGLKITDMESRP
jgi:hypothetical protein